ncbi:MAG: 1-acyl-sn-glycerol-3-phosphate acyltransferase [Candidatus Limimorpha sp.]
MGKIQDDNNLYSFLRHPVDYHIRRGFKRYQVIGKENIPTGSANIFASNHCNALTDALVILATDSKKKVFIARADIFKNPKIAKILRWLRILPIYRIRDGIGTVRDNNADIINQAVDVIHDSVPLNLYPEATHRTKHSLRQLSKGIFHIAMQANREFGNEKPIYIIPTGLDYGDYFRYRSTILISFGEPINVTEYMKEHEGETDAFIMNGLKAILSEKMSKLITFIPDDEDYDAIWELTKINVKKGNESPKERRERNNAFIAKILDLREKQPDKARELFDKAKAFCQKRKKSKISVISVAKKKPFWNTLLTTLLIIIGLPFFLLASAVSLPTWITASIILKSIKDPAFRNTVNYGVELLMNSIVSFTEIILLFCLTPWEIALAGSIFVYFSYIFFLDYCQYFRAWCSDIRWFFNKKLRKEASQLKIF